MMALIPAFGLGTASAQTLDYFKKYGPGSDNGGARSVTSTRDGNIALVSAIPSATGGALDLYVVKTKTNGDTLWTRRIGEPDADEYAYNITQLPNDDGFYVAGFTADTSGSTAAALLMRLGLTGNVIWKQTYPVANANTYFADLKVLNDGIILCGGLGNTANGKGDGWLVKVNNAGVKQWDKTYGGVDYDEFTQLEKLPNQDGFMIGGSTESYHTGTSGQSAWIVKTDYIGTEKLSKAIGTATSVDGIAAMTTGSRLVSTGGTFGYVFVGYKNYDKDSLKSQLLFCKVDTNGNVLWDKSMYVASRFIEGFAVEEAYDGGFYIGGTVLSTVGLQMVTIKTDQVGNTVNRVYYGANTDYVAPRSIFLDTYGNAYVAGEHFTQTQQSVAFLSRIGDINKVPTTGVEQAPKATAGVSVFPNPATNGCTVTSVGEPIRRIQIRDITGRILQDIAGSGSNTEKISLDGMPKGTVLVYVFTGRTAAGEEIAPEVVKLTII